MLFPLGFDAKLKHEKREKQEETNYIVSFMFHLNNTSLRIVRKEMSPPLMKLPSLYEGMRWSWKHALNKNRKKHLFAW